MSAELRPAAKAAVAVAVLLPLVLGLLWLRAPEAQQQAVGYVAPAIADTGSLEGPRQPIFFRHDVHAGQYQMDCRYCHYAVEVSPYPGLPSMETCMGCHRITGAALPEVQKLREAAGSGQAIRWVKVHDLPQFVRFPHMRHVRAGIACQTCLGPVERMAQVYPRRRK